MSLINIEQGAVATSTTLNSNFNYLDDRCDTLAATKANNSGLVHTTGIETIAGNKTFQGNTTFSGNVSCASGTTTTLAGTNAITGATTISGALTSSGANTFSGTNTFSGAVTFSDTVTLPTDTSGVVTEKYESGSSGYIVFSNKLCIQWGVYTGTIGAYVEHEITLQKTYKDTNYIVKVTGSPADYIVGASPTTTNTFKHRARWFDDDIGGQTAYANVYWETTGYLT